MNPINSKFKQFLLDYKTIIIVVAVIIVVVAVIYMAAGKKSIPSIAVQNQNLLLNQPINPTSQDAFNTNLNTVNFDAPVNPASSKDITGAEKRTVYESLLAGYKIMTSKDAKAIRAYITEKATTPAEKNLVTKMSDADLVSLSIRLTQTMIMPLPTMFLTSSSIWTRDGNTITIQYADLNTGTTTKKVVNINGKWY